jgi:hypothetical protein
MPASSRMVPLFPSSFACEFGTAVVSVMVMAGIFFSFEVV